MADVSYGSDPARPRRTRCCRTTRSTRRCPTADVDGAPALLRGRPRRSPSSEHPRASTYRAGDVTTSRSPGARTAERQPHPDGLVGHDIEDEVAIAPGARCVFEDVRDAEDRRRDRGHRAPAGRPGQGPGRADRASSSSRRRCRRSEQVASRQVHRDRVARHRPDIVHARERRQVAQASTSAITAAGPAPRRSGSRRTRPATRRPRCRRRPQVIPPSARRGAGGAAPSRMTSASCYRPKLRWPMSRARRASRPGDRDTAIVRQPRRVKAHGRRCRDRECARQATRPPEMSTQSGPRTPPRPAAAAGPMYAS